MEFLDKKNEFLVLDFETRSGTGINKGLPAYFRDKKFKALVLCCVHVKEEETKAFSIPMENIPSFCKSLIKFSEKNYIVAHNAEFDFLAFQTLTGVGDSYFSRWIDTKNLSCYGGGPSSLKESCIFWNVQRKIQGMDLIKTLSIPYDENRTPRVVNGVLTASCVNKDGFVENDSLLEKFIDYCKGDVKSTSLLFKKFKKNKILLEYMEAGFQGNAYINSIRNKRGVNFDIELVKKLKSEKEKLEKMFKEEGVKLTRIKGFNLNSSVQFNSFMGTVSSDKQYLNGFLHKNFSKLSNERKKLIKLRINRPKTALGKLNRVLEDSDNGKIKSSISYLEAFTGRYKSFGVNLLAFPRNVDVDPVKAVEHIKNNSFADKYKIESPEVLMGLLRRCIIPHKGHVFYGGDFSSIELRLLLGCAKEFKALKKMHEGWDVYKYMAGVIYKKPESKVTKQERYVAKRVVLARGYGLGVDGICKALMKDNIFITPLTASKLIVLYENLFPNVSLFWNSLFKPIMDAVEGEDVKIRIPFIGRHLYFKDVRHDIDLNTGYLAYTFNRKGSRVGIYKSALCGLVIQCLAFCLFLYIERELYKRLGILAVIPEHDEFLCSVNEKKVSFEEFKRIIQTSPPWLPEKHFPVIQGTAWKGRFWA